MTSGGLNISLAMKCRGTFGIISNKLSIFSVFRYNLQEPRRKGGLNPPLPTPPYQEREYPESQQDATQITAAIHRQLRAR